VVKLRHDRLHAKDSSSEDGGFLDRIEREIALEGPLTQAQRDRLLEVAEKCPVNRALCSSIAVETRLAEGARIAGEAQAGA
jgi:putative redox protein